MIPFTKDSPIEKNKSFFIKTSFWIILIISGVLATLVSLEICLRLSGFIILAAQEHRNITSVRQKGQYRILCLGESMTQGQYPVLLEEILNGKNIGVKFSVIDEGISGTNTDFIIARLEANLDKYQPDLVVTMMGNTDLINYIAGETDPTNKGIRFLKSFKTYKLIRILWLHVIAKAKERDSRVTDPWVDDISPLETEYKKALEVNPHDTSAYIKLGRFYRRQGKVEEAERWFKKAIEANPQDARAYITLGNFYMGYNIIKFTKEAERLYKKALKIDPKNGWGYAELGNLYLTRREFIRAEWLFKKAIKICPKDQWAYTSLGYFYLQSLNLVEVERICKKAIEVEPKNERAYRMLTVVYGQIHNDTLRKEYERKIAQMFAQSYTPVTINNYRRLKQILDRRKIKLICVQYPMRSVEELKKIFEVEGGVCFVDNEEIFKSAVLREGYIKYFCDASAGDFGHCTSDGNKLLAENISSVILKEVFNK